jgi:hypothetical protein
MTVIVNYLINVIVKLFNPSNSKPFNDYNSKPFNDYNSKPLY